MTDNKKLGSSFEKEMLVALQAKGYWAHFFTPGINGQPCDILAAKDQKTFLIDAKYCSTKRFPFSRVEENQRFSMNHFEECGNKTGLFAIKFPDGKIFMLSLVSIQYYESFGKVSITEQELIEGLVPEFERWCENNERYYLRIDYNRAKSETEHEVVDREGTDYT